MVLGRVIKINILVNISKRPKGCISIFCLKIIFYFLFLQPLNVSGYREQYREQRPKPLPVVLVRRGGPSYTCGVTPISYPGGVSENSCGTLPISAVPIKWLDCDEGYNLPGPCLVGQLVLWKWVISGLMHIIKISWVSMVIESN